jgi:hypothetical protein
MRWIYYREGKGSWWRNSGRRQIERGREGEEREGKLQGHSTYSIIIFR